MIIFNLSEEDMAYAEQLQSYAEMSAIIKAPKSFSSEELNLLQIGATTILPSYIPDGFVEMDVQYNAVTQPVSLYCLLGNGDSSITLLYTVFSENHN